VKFSDETINLHIGCLKPCL